MSREHKAFTLIELLVVVAIIAVLIAMLLPSIQQARDTAKTVYCSNNLRQLGVFFQNYYNDYNGWVPWSLHTNPSPNYMWRILLINLYMTGQSIEKIPYFQCPADTYSLPFDYGMNSYINNQDPAWSSDGRWGFICQVDSFREPARTVLLGDNGALNESNSCLLPFTPSWAQVCPRHGQGGANFLFLDGHVALYRGYPLTTPWEQRYIPDGTIWKFWQVP